ncbi:RNA-binding, RBD [Glarea lozoyensis ATCC 20868]|uniref:Nucleolar protein 12 n=1 Tax=Glarea lozoyensis (strain ATCC 20868 / MF5171) TaxID=1116229 RepID=S3DGR5_GLAL2|nr:RNA-binding, RBD [Glarea lozoyensis ATCC 20868]EPE36314.1 RNA-binding, RBD [Glarea lozoyensis ATCC 20868]
MGKRSKQTEDGVEGASKKSSKIHTKKSVLSDETAVDPSLALLFASSSGPVQAPPKSRYQEPPPTRKRVPSESEDEEEDESEDGGEADGHNGDLSSIDEDLEDANISGLSEDEEEAVEEEPKLDKIIEAVTQKPEKKRKRARQEEDLEGKYMAKLAREEEKEEEERQAERRLKRQKIVAKKDASEDEDEDMEDASDAQSADEAASDDDDTSEDDANASGRAPPPDVPVHESLAPSKESSELEKATRTVFLANVSTEAISSKSAKKTLMAHMGSFLDSLPDPPEGKPAHKVESLRFRSTAYAGGGGLPKKAAFVKKDLMGATTKSTNAYVVYSTAYAAREAVKRLNGTMVLDRHLRVDGVAHPAKTDHRRCVFVGNLGFVDDESLLDQGGETERKRSKIPSDIEEGLWRQFGKAGTVESVRVVRDEKTRVGKGFAYVQFEDANAVEAALLFNEKKYPPMLPRVLRVVRAKAVRKTALASQQFQNKNSKRPSSKPQIYNPKTPAEEASLHGRAGKLLGRAGAAQLKKGKLTGANDMVMGKRGDGAKSIEGIAKTPEAIVFEGYRASAKNGRPKDLKMGGKGKGKKKPTGRAAKRTSAWKSGGSKKGGKDS